MAVLLHHRSNILGDLLSVWRWMIDMESACRGRNERRRRSWKRAAARSALAIWCQPTICIFQHRVNNEKNKKKRKKKKKKRRRVCSGEATKNRCHHHFNPALLFQLIIVIDQSGGIYPLRENRSIRYRFHTRADCIIISRFENDLSLN